MRPKCSITCELIIFRSSIFFLYSYVFFSNCFSVSVFSKAVIYVYMATSLLYESVFLHNVYIIFTSYK